MRKFISIVSLALAVASVPGLATAKGCLKGAAVGGVAGHVAGGHSVVGAAAGCGIEHHRETKKAKAAQRAEPAPSSNPAPAPAAAPR